MTSAELEDSCTLLVEKAADLGFNTLFFQVRPAGDALYKSQLAPFSSYVSGQQGKNADKDFDPLDFFLRQCHIRGLRLYAWLNPFRFGAPSIKTYDSSIYANSPGLIVHDFGNGYRWLDPASKKNRSYLYRIVLELIDTYPIDGLVLDDYFYPYRDQLGGLVDFPDATAYEDYAQGGGELKKADWRRANSQIFIQGLYDTIKGRCPNLALGLSPAGIWRPDALTGIVGRDSYAESFYDSREWLRKGCLDFLSPQLYWPVSKPEQSFAGLLAFWMGQNRYERAIFPSLRPAPSTYDVKEAQRESQAQLLVSRAMLGTKMGFILFSASTLNNEANGIKEALRACLKPSLVLPPLYANLDTTGPPILEASFGYEQGLGYLVWQAPQASELLVDYHIEGQPWQTRLLPRGESTYQIGSIADRGKKLRLRLRAIGPSGRFGQAFYLDTTLTFPEVDNTIDYGYE